MINKMMTKEQLGNILATTRTTAKMSQRDMARSLNVSIGTISNWEQGMGCPDMVEFLEWFEACKMIPMKAILEFFYPNTYKYNDSEKERTALIHYIKEVATDDEIEKLAFNIYGNTGSNWRSQLEMWTAHNNTSLRSRVNAAQFILDSYEIEKARDELITGENIQPNEELLRNAINAGKKSAIDRKNSYS